MEGDTQNYHTPEAVPWKGSVFQFKATNEKPVMLHLSLAGALRCSPAFPDSEAFPDMRPVRDDE